MGAAIGLHLQRGQPAPGEDVAIGLQHPLVADLHPLLVGIEAVQVLHVELPDPQQAGTGTRLVTELALNLVEHLGRSR